VSREVGEHGVSDGRVGANRVAESLNEDRQQLGPPGVEPAERGVKRHPQLGATAEEADHQQVVERLVQLRVARIGGVGNALDRADQARRAVSLVAR
jgi:hypothetical protein